MFLFEIEDRSCGTRKHILHTGDFRATKSITSNNEHLKKFHKSSCQHTFDVVYLDTTYSSPLYKFPPLELVCQVTAKNVHQIVALENKRKLVPFSYLVVVGSYTVGKEKIAVDIAKVLNTKIYVRPEKLRVMECLEWPELLSLLTGDPSKALVHILPMNLLQKDGYLSSLLDSLRPNFSHIIAIRPTGWSSPTKIDESAPTKGRAGPSSSPPHTRPLFPGCVVKKVPYRSLVSISGAPPSRDRITLYEVPYSEHSSFDELVSFLNTFSMSKVMPTVPMSGDALSRYFPK